MFMHPRPFRADDMPRTIVVIDTESQYDTQAHGRYLDAERFTAEIHDGLNRREAREDPRIKPRWPCQRITTMSWLILHEGPDGLVPHRMETRGFPEQDECAILTAFFADMQQLGSVRLVSWGGFSADLPQLVIGAMAAGLPLPDCLKGLLSPWRREQAGHTDLMTEMCAGAARPHMAEVAARLGIPTKLTCRPDLVTWLMDRGKWSDVRAVCEGDVLTLTAILMLWMHLDGRGASPLEGMHRLSRFVADHLGHRSYAEHWAAFASAQLREAFARETGKLAILAPHLAE